MGAQLPEARPVMPTFFSPVPGRAPLTAGPPDTAMGNMVDRYLEVSPATRGVTCTARLPDDGAPVTCAAVRDPLPLGGDVHHATYARNEIYALFPPFADTEPPLENPTVPPEARRLHVGRLGAADALFLSCTNLPACDVIPQLEAELRIPVISANQVAMWAALRRWGTRAVGPYQALIDVSARSGTVLPGRTPGPVLPDAPEEKQQEGWT